jgi:protein-tyrosine phosphatase
MLRYVIQMLPVDQLRAFAISQGIDEIDLPRQQPDPLRRVPLQGSYNFCDAGGYPTIDGRRVATGRIFRSDHLNELTDDDRNKIAQLGLKRVYDFRLASEIERQPSKWVGEGAVMPFEIVHLALTDATVDATMIDIIRDMIAGKGPLPPPTFWDDNYRKMITDARGMFVAVIGTLTEKLPVAYHCTGGKDRTGMTSAFLLSLLGVDRETIIDDFLLTNLYRTSFRIQQLRDSLVAAGVDPIGAIPILGVCRSAIERTLNDIDSLYGGVEQYLIDGGLDSAVPSQLRAALLH